MPEAGGETRRDKILKVEQIGYRDVLARLAARFQAGEFTEEAAYESFYGQTSQKKKGGADQRRLRALQRAIRSAQSQSVISHQITRDMPHRWKFAGWALALLEPLKPRPTLEPTAVVTMEACEDLMDYLDR